MSSARLESPSQTVKRPILEIQGLKKTHSTARHELTVLHGIHLTLDEGDTLAVTGPSGSGKTTLLGLCAGLDDATAGSMKLDGHALEELSQDARAALRNRLVGFVFQNFQLIPTLTALENVLVPLELRGESGRQSDAENLLREVGLGDRMDHYPAQLSGGEQQRVALARAFIHRPKILLADEPTGNLDPVTAGYVFDALSALVKQSGLAALIATHNHELAARMDRRVTLKDGKIVPF